MSVQDDWYVRLDVETTSSDLLQQAKDVLTTYWPDWTEVPGKSELDSVMLSAWAVLTQNAAEVCARMPPAALRAFGTKLLGVPYGTGTPARTTLTLVAPDTLGHVVPANFEFDIDGYAFSTDAEAVIPSGSATLPGVAVSATNVGTAQNGLTGALVAPIGTLPFVLADVIVGAPTANGTDAQDDLSYQSDVSQRLQLLGDTLVTERDIEIFSLLQPNVGRAVFQNDGARNVNGVATALDGTALTGPEKTSLDAAITALLVANTNVTITDATYTAVGVKYGIHPHPGYDQADLVDRVNSVLHDVFLPLNWRTQRGPEPIPGFWDLDAKVRVNVIIDVIADVDGVDYVDLVISGGTIDGTNQKDTIDFTGTVSGGNFDLGVDGQSLLAIPYNTTLAALSALLISLSNTEAGDFILTGGPGPTDIVIEWTGKYAHRARTVTVTSHVTGGGSVARTATQAEVDGSGDSTLPGTFPLTTPGTMTGYIV
jgi:hypothetical protein